MAKAKVTPHGFIDDGFTLPFEIKEEPGKSIGIKGEYRPALRATVMRVIHTIPTNGDEGEAQDAMACEVVASHLISWDVKDRNGKAVEITAANVARLRPGGLIAELLNIVCSQFGTEEATAKN